MTKSLRETTRKPIKLRDQPVKVALYTTLVGVSALALLAILTYFAAR